jgi:hypothetical protein
MVYEPFAMVQFKANEYQNWQLVLLSLALQQLWL